MLKEFTDFLRAYGIIGLAIAVIIGGKLNDLIGSLVNDLITPVLLRPMLQATGVDDVRKLSYEGILYGKVLGSAIDFLVVAILVFVFAKFILKEEKVAKK
jgi:large conductance mechanosensitive channel